MLKGSLPSLKAARTPVRGRPPSPRRVTTSLPLPGLPPCVGRNHPGHQSSLLRLGCSSRSLPSRKITSLGRDLRSSLSRSCGLATRKKRWISGDFNLKFPRMEGPRGSTMQRMCILHCLHEMRSSDPPCIDLYLYLHTAACRTFGVSNLLVFYIPHLTGIQLGTQRN